MYYAASAQRHKPTVQLKLNAISEIATKQQKSMETFLYSSEVPFLYYNYWLQNK